MSSLSSRARALAWAAYYLRLSPRARALAWAAYHLDDAVLYRDLSLKTRDESKRVLLRKVMRSEALRWRAKAGL